MGGGQIFADFSDFLGRLQPSRNYHPEDSRDSGSSTQQSSLLSNSTQDYWYCYWLLLLLLVIVIGIGIAIGIGLIRRSEGWKVRRLEGKKVRDDNLV